MQEQIRQVANRIRELREIFGVPPAQLAQELQIDPEEYREYESGEADIPLGALYRIAHRFNVEMSALLTGHEPRLHTYALTRAGQGVSVDRRQDYKYQSLAYNFIHKKAEPFLVTVEPKPKGAPEHLNSHPGQEFNYVLEGELCIVLAGHEIVMHSGDSLFFDSGVPHGMRALGGQPALFLAVVL